MKLLLILVFLCMSITSPDQNSKDDNLNQQLITNFYPEYKTPAKRRILNLKDKGIVSKLNPLTYISAGLLFIYQQTLSEQIQAECLYQTSCSNYTKFQIEKNGFRGFLLGFHQLNNCVPWAIYDYESCRITSENKIINKIDKIKQ